MSGAATFAGTNYQGAVIGYVSVHILSQAPLEWFDGFLDIPTAVSGETGGPGDDARVEFGSQHEAVEVQAKHGLTGGAKLRETVEKAAARRRDGAGVEVVLVVDGSASQSVQRDFARDLVRLRTGRTDDLRGDIRALLDGGGAAADLLGSIRVVCADLDEPNGAARKDALRRLEGVLRSSSQASAAWAVLRADGAAVCEHRARRTRAELVRLLEGKGIGVRPPEPDETAMRLLDFSRRLLQERRGSAAVDFLKLVEADLRGKTVGPAVWARFWQHRAAALLQVQKAAEALAAARQALALEKRNRHALLTACHAAAEAEDLAAAQEYVRSLLEESPEDAEAWGARIQIERKAGMTSADPPEEVRVSAPYRFALAQIAANEERPAEVAAIARPLVAMGHREPQLVVLLTTALLALDAEAGTDDNREEAEGLVNEALASLGDEDNLTARFLAQRAELRRLRGDVAGCREDIERAREVRTNDPNTLGQVAFCAVRAHQLEDALRVLSAAVVEEHPMLLLLRARVRCDLDDTVGARKEWQAAIAAPEKAADPDALRLSAAELAIELGDVPAAEQLLGQISADAGESGVAHVFRGRIACERGDAASMIEAYRGAVAAMPGKKPALLQELAQRLVRLGKWAEGAAVFEEVGVQALPSMAHVDYARALLGAHQLERLSSLVADVADDPQAPDWKLQAAAELSVRRGDLGTAVALLGRFQRRHPESVEVAYHLARRLLELRQPAAAKVYLDSLVERSAALQPDVMLSTAFLLKEAGRGEDARALALRAYRANPSNASIHRGYGTLLMTDTTPIEPPREVGADTYVRLDSEDGTTRHYLVYGEPPTDPSRNELRVEEAERLGILGKRLGDVVVTGGKGWSEKRWRVAELLPACTHVWREVMAHFSERFPDEAPFVESFPVSEKPTIRELAPIIASVHDRQKAVAGVYAHYREQTLPLGFVAGMINLGVADVMAGAMLQEFGPLAVEWVDLAGQEVSRTAARAATSVVLTRSGLETLFRLGLLETLGPRFQWIAPQSLIEALEHECADAAEKVRVGHRTMTASETGFEAAEWLPEDPLLVARKKRAEMLREWVRENARTEYRPVGTIRAPESEEEDMRRMVGPDSMDAVSLAAHLDATLFADDLGLRRFGPDDKRVSSFSSVALLPILAEREVISVADRDAHLLRLVSDRYTIVPPTSELLLCALHAPDQGRATAERAFGLLGHPGLPLDAAARIAAEVLRAVAVAPLQTIGLDRVVGLVLGGMVEKWPGELSAAAVEEAVRKRFSLLPGPLEEVRKACKAFRRTRVGWPRLLL